MQKKLRNKYKQYKDKYVLTKQIYNSIRENIKVRGERGDKYLSYKDYTAILTAYLEEIVEEVAINQEVVNMPLNLGSLFIKKLPHKRPFHVRMDLEKSNEINELVLYKVPILDDEYTKLVWERPYKYSKFKVLPLNKFKRKIKHER